jgi:hypothetical protein
MTLGWLPPLIAGTAAILGLFLSKPKRRRIAAVVAALIALTSIYQAAENYLTERRERLVQSRIADRLARATWNFLEMFAAVAIRGSDGFIPDNDDKFFSQRMAEILCRETNVRSSPPGFPKDMLEPLATSTKQFHEEVTSLLDAHPADMTLELLTALKQVEACQIFNMLELGPKLRERDEELGTASAPLLCWGLEPLMGDCLAALKKLAPLVRLEERRFSITAYPEDWLYYPPQYVVRFMGTSRFGPEQLSKFRADHPGAPGPGFFGKRNPSKGFLPDKRSNPLPLP